MAMQTIIVRNTGRCRLHALLLGMLLAAGSGAIAKQHTTTRLYVQMLKRVTDVMVEDVTSPVAAARYYAYVTLSAAEVMQAGDQRFAAINGYTPYKPKVSAPVDHQAVAFALLRSGERLLPSGYRLRPVIDSLLQLWGPATQANYVAADSAVAHVVRFAATDGFRQLSGLRRYTPVEGDAYWQPTPPGFLAPVEPQWRTIRPLLLPNVLVIRAAPPAPYDTSANSAFMRLVKEVYDTCTRLSTAQQDIAMFWDCNPFAVQQIGHMEFGLKKISPGGHWMGITGIACLQRNTDLAKTVMAHWWVAATLHDAFIACWHEKYSSNRVRPETVIRRLVDVNWRPLLQTPPFPEYTSGHSVASSAVAEVLTSLFGHPFAFSDDTEVEFGLPVRRFQSFRHAADEASVSRLYGGIHFRDAIENGVVQGRQIGLAIVGKFRPVLK